MKNIFCFFGRPFKIQKNGVFRFEISFFHFRDIDVFLLCKLDQWWRHTVCNWKVVKYWINYISGNIKAVFLKLGITKETKWHPLCFCHDNSLATGAVLIKKLKFPEPSTPHNLLMVVEIKWELFLFQVAPFVSIQGLQMGIFVFWTERDWSWKSCYGNTLRVSFVSFVMHIYAAKFQEHCFPEVLFIQYFTITF